MDFQTFDTIRKNYVSKLKKLIIPVVIMLIFMIIGLPLSQFFAQGIYVSGYLTFVAILFFILTFILIVLANSSRKTADAYRDAYKTYFVSQALSHIFTDIKYEKDQGIKIEELRATDMIRLGNVYSSNDFFSAKYHDVALRQADVDIKEKYTDSDGHTHYITIFKGRWMIFEFPKPFTFRLQVVQKRFPAEKKAGKNRETGRKLKKISTESITFDREFTVLAEDDFEAYYLLDPAFIDHIEQLTANQNRTIMLCFKDNQLHVAVHDGKDAFEPPSPFKEIDEEVEFAKTKQDIKTITDYVDFLKLDRKLFSTKK